MGVRVSLWARRAPFTHSLASKSASENLEKSISLRNFLPKRIIRQHIHLRYVQNETHVEEVEVHTAGRAELASYIEMASVEALHFVSPGDVITTDSGFMR